jgi:hypothetical protein
VLKESRSWNNNPSEDHPVVALLRDERKKRKKDEKGWLRQQWREENNLPPVTMNKQLKIPEKDLVVNIFAAVGGHPSNWKGDLAFAMGKTVRALEYVDGRSLKNNLKNS